MDDETKENGISEREREREREKKKKLVFAFWDLTNFVLRFPPNNKYSSVISF